MQVSNAAIAESKAVAIRPALRDGVEDTRGQATVEYLIVGLVLVIVFVVMAQLADVLSEGTFVSHAASSASHVAAQAGAGVVGDVFLY